MASTLDDLENLSVPSGSGTNGATGDHLHYPVINTEEPITDEGHLADQPPRQLLKDRLYIGNLHPTVDEYSLLQIFSKFGKVSKLDFLFHKTGLLKGKPRGYAFVEYGNKDDALKALTMAHDKPLRGRKLVVTFAHQAPLDQYGGSVTPSTFKSRKAMMDVSRPTTLSMLKTAASGRHEAKTTDKIAMMEAKLRQMERTTPKPAVSQDESSMDYTPSPDPASAPSSLPYHSSLPMKPPPSLPPQMNGNHPTTSSLKMKLKAPLPSLPIAPMAHLLTQGSGSGLKSSSTPPLGKSKTPPGFSARSNKPTKLIGVKIKPKEKEKEAKKE